MTDKDEQDLTLQRATRGRRKSKDGTKVSKRGTGFSLEYTVRSQSMGSHPPKNNIVGTRSDAPLAGPPRPHPRT
jgi:hypothetical protein